MRASRLLRVRAVWIAPLVLGSILISVMAVIYLGSVIDPTSHLRGLPVLLVNQDAGGIVQSQPVNLGNEVASGLQQSPTLKKRLSLRSMTLAEATAEMNNDHAYAAIVVPPGFTHSMLAVYSGGSSISQAPPLPTIQILTNGRAGSIGVNLATGFVGPVLAGISKNMGNELSERADVGTAGPSALVALRADPMTVATVPYRPLPPHSALGLSAFYVSLLVIMCGFLGATLVNSTVDSALGYATNEIGPRWRQRMPVRITRWQTLLSKWVMAIVLMPILTGILLVVSIAILRMDAPHALLLWLFGSLAAAVVAIGTLVLFAIFGSLGQLLAMIIFVYLALASSGGTIPVQALPGPLRFAAAFEPLRQVLDGVRSILYYNASGAAGLRRGLEMTGLGLILWVALGVAVTQWYDRRGMYRMEPALVDYVERSARVYREAEPVDAAADQPASISETERLPPVPPD